MKVKNYTSLISSVYTGSSEKKSLRSMLNISFASRHTGVGYVAKYSQTRSFRIFFCCALARAQPTLSAAVELYASRGQCDDIGSRECPMYYTALASRSPLEQLNSISDLPDEKHHCQINSSLLYSV
jgi:hypothetical protein